jgi:hypothetical protein
MTRKKFVLGCIIPVLLVLVLYIAYKVHYYSRPVSWGPANRKELCTALERDYKTDPLCKNKRIFGENANDIILLLESTFPRGLANRDQVHAHLKDYYLDSYKLPDDEGYRDNFAIYRAFFSKEEAWVASFLFDENDILIEISVFTGWLD